MSYKVCFKCIKGKDKNKVWKVDFNKNKTIVIGRLEGCHIVINDKKVSESHCLIQVQNNKLCLIEMGSTYGTKVNGKKVKDIIILNNGDIIEIGNSKIKITFEKLS